MMRNILFYYSSYFVNNISFSNFQSSNETSVPTNSPSVQLLLSLHTSSSTNPQPCPSQQKNKCMADQ